MHGSDGPIGNDFSDDTGGFHFSVSPSALTLDVKRIGYRPGAFVAA